MINSDQRHLIDDVPPNIIQGELAYNVVKAIGDQEEKLFSEIDKSIIRDENLESQPDEVIWHLLWENHLIEPSEGLLLTKDKKERIELIRSSVELHRTKGTPYAIERALEAVGLKGNVVEWFEYGGAPYHFLVKLVLEDIVEQSDKTKFKKMIYSYKNTRSFLEGIGFKGNFIFIQLLKHFLDNRIRIQTHSNPWAQAGVGATGEDIRLNGEYLLNGDRFLNGFYNKGGPAHLQNIRLVLKVHHNFGIYQVNLKPSLDGEFNLDGEILLQHEPQLVNLTVLHDAKLRYKQHYFIDIKPKQVTPMKSMTKHTSGVVTLNGQVSLDGSTNLDQALLNHSGLFRVKKSGNIIEEVAI